MEEVSDFFFHWKINSIFLHMEDNLNILVSGNDLQIEKTKTLEPKTYKAICIQFKEQHSTATSRQADQNNNQKYMAQFKKNQP